MPVSTEKQKWLSIKAELESGISVMDLCRSGRYNATPAQVWAKQRAWQKEKYKKGSGAYAKYQTEKYKNWRLAVLKKGNYKCVVCKRGKPEVKVLQCDHIKSWALNPELRYDVNNGRVLCVYHHKRTLNYGRKALTCDDSLNGVAWILKEQLLWKQKQQKTLKRKIVTATSKKLT